MTKFFSAVLFCYACIGTANAAEAPCHTAARAVLDVGSGSTKLTVSEVEICTEKNRLVRVLDDSKSLAVPLEAGKNKSGEISAAAIEQLSKAIAELKSAAASTVRSAGLKTQTVEIAAAGTHAFRTAKNQSAVAEAVFKKTGVRIKPLTQEQEAMAGMAAVKGEACAGKELIVWDIGGGSMQLTRPLLKPEVTGLSIGAETFKSKVMAKFKLKGDGNCPVKRPTPNPVGTSNVEKAAALAEAEVKSVPPALKTGAFCAVGIGGVHNKAVEEQIAKNWDSIRACVCAGGQECRHTPRTYTLAETKCLARYWATKNDCDPALAGDYSTTAVTNLILIEGLMRGLKIERVHTESVNMGHGLAVDRSLLEFRPISN